MHVSIQRVDQTLPLPAYHTAGSVGFDLITRQTTVIEPGKIALVPGNVIVKVPEGTALLIVPRSSLPRKKALVCPHSFGIIDCDYHGPEDEILVQVQNIGDAPVTVERGERIAQGVFVKIEKAEWDEVDGHPSTPRLRSGQASSGSMPKYGIDGAETRGGFGSTGEGIGNRK